MGNKLQKLFLVFDTEFFSFMGVFTTAEQAIGCCSTIMHGVGPALLDVAVPHDPVKWPGFWWPLREPMPKENLPDSEPEREGKVMVEEPEPSGPSREFLASMLQCNDEEYPNPEPINLNGHIEVALAEYPSGWNSPVVYCPNMPDIKIAKIQAARIVEELVNTQPCPPDTLDFVLKCPDFYNEISLADEPKKPEPYYKTLKGKRGSK